MDLLWGSKKFKICLKVCYLHSLVNGLNKLEEIPKWTKISILMQMHFSFLSIIPLF